MQVQQNAGAPAPPPSGNQPVIIQQKKSNTCCIVTLVLCCLCVVVPIIIVVALFATAVSTISSIDLTVPTQPPAGPSGNIPQYYMNVCQPDSPAEFLTGGETWTSDDIASPMGGGDPALASHSFILHTPNFFDGNGDFDFPISGPAPLAATDCTFKITPADANEKIFIMGFPNIGETIHADKNITDLTTDMPDCGDTFVAINTVRKCGTVDYMSNDMLVLTTFLEFNAGESVEIVLKTVDNAEVDFGFSGFIIYTGTSAPSRSIDTSKTF